MPIGIMIMHWNDRSGSEILAKYPVELEIQEKTLMQLYSQHEYTGGAGMVSLMAGAANLASYYTGRETAIYLILVMTSEEEADIYEEGMVEITRLIMANLAEDVLQKMLPSFYQRLSVYPTLNNEQRLAMLVQSDIKRMILNRLREEVMVPKSELAVWLQETYREGFVDIENIVTSMVQAGLVKIASIKGITSDLVFLVEDIFMIRKPLPDLIRNPVEHHLPESLKNPYLVEVKNFFKNYTPSEKDCLAVIDNILLNPGNYELLKLLREAMVTRNDVEKLRKKGLDDVDASLKAFWEQNMIAVIQDANGTEYYCLINDFYIEKFFPEYNINNIRHHYMNKTHNPNALLKALDLMKEEYSVMEKAKKEAPTIK